MATSLNGFGLTVSIVVRTYNEEGNLRILLPILRAQQLSSSIEKQVIVVDSGSTDGTKAVAGEYGAAIVSLSSDAFSWGRALNRGIEAAKGELVVLLSADAHPVGDYWLESICEPFGMEDVGVVYGRQIPRASAPLDEWVRVNRKFPAIARSWSADDIREKKIVGLIASNACAVIRRELWKKHPYDEECHGAEERPWTYSILNDGFKALYVCDAVVEHSHRDPVMKQALRLWELRMEESRKDCKAVRIIDVVLFVGVFLKNRLRSLRVGGAGTVRRIKAIFSTPIEVLALSAVSLATFLGVDYSKMRRRW